MDATAKRQVTDLTVAMSEAARYGKCPADVRGALLMVMKWMRSEKRDFVEWAQVTNYAHGEWLDWYIWITECNTRPLPENDGLTSLELAELFIEAGNTVKIRGVA